jgi:hypothetical protein
MDASISKDTTISVTFSSPKGFEHNFTINQEITDKEVYEDIEDKTIEKARERLKNGYTAADGKTEQDWIEKGIWNEIQASMDIQLPEEVLDFLEKKEALPYLQVAENLTQTVYGRVDTGRAISIQQRINQSTRELGDLTEDQRENAQQLTLADIKFQTGNNEYYSNLKKVNQNLDFEQNIEDGDVLLEDRQRTTGELTWYNREGEKRYFLITSVGVTMQDSQGGTVLRTFNDKTQAWNYYRENRLG